MQASIRFIFLGLISFLAINATAQEKPEWDNPDIVQVNRMDPHATFFPFENI